MIELIHARGVRVAEFELQPRTDGLWHRHSQMSEHCYCLKGQLLIEIGERQPVGRCSERTRLPGTHANPSRLHA